MSEIDFEKKYRERYARWQDKTIAQLSFFNNLLLTLSVGFLSFAYKNILESKIEFCLCHPKFSTSILIISITTIVLSIIVGISCVINRLYDFRITTHINQVRYWFEKSQKKSITKIRLDEKTPEDYCYCKRLILIYKVLFEKYPRIKIEDCDEYQDKLSENEKNEFKDKFRILRNIAHNLSLGTWNKLKWQIGLFLIGILLFVIVQIYR